MPAAADLDEAAQFAMQNSFIQFAGANTLKNQFGLWLAALAANLDPESVQQRTVLNWVPIGRPLEVSLPSIKAEENSLDADGVGVCLFRICRAAEAAENAGRISAAQATALVAAYNGIWP